MRPRSASFIGAVAIASATALPISPAFADGDAKVYAANTCQEEGSDTGAFNRSAFRITRIGSSGNGRLDCPIVRDIVDDCGVGILHGGAQASDCKVSALVHTFRSFTAVIGQDPSEWPQAGPLDCTLFSRNYTGSVIGFDTEFAGLGDDTMELNALTHGADSGSYMLSCGMPVNGAQFAKLFSYKVIE
jgi:hypothetical protein